MTDQSHWVTDENVAVLCGGVGAAKLLRGLVQVCDPSKITAVVNTADDVVLHGLHISPDLDTCTYTLADAINPQTGWGLAGESWNAMETLGRYGGIDWFSLGDRDLGTHLFRTQRLAEGARLDEITTEITAAWGIDCRLIPMTNDRVETRVVVDGEGDIGFQEYFVRLRHAVPTKAIRFEGIDHAEPAPGVLDAFDAASLIIVAPSNPIVSVGPILAIPGMRDALRGHRGKVLAVSPIIDGQALKGPAADMLRDADVRVDSVGVAELYADIASTLALDPADAGLCAPVGALGVAPFVTDTIMADTERAAAIAAALLEQGLRG